MFRFFGASVALALSIAGPAAKAQENDTAWRNFMLQAMRAAGAKDYPKSQEFFQKAVTEAERFGPRDPRIGTSLNSLGLVYRAEKKFGEAEAAYRRALSIMEAAYGETIDVGNVNFNIAGVLFDENRPADALPNIRRTVAIYERLLGGNSMKTAAALCIEGDAYRLTKQFSEAEGPLHRCADIREKNGGIQSPELADALYSLALTYAGEGKFAAAEPRFALAEKIREKTAGITSPLLAQTMRDHAAVLKSLGRDQEAEKLTAMADAIRRDPERQRGESSRRSE